MVAVIQQHLGGDLVADFSPQTRARYGNYFVNVITDARAKSLYYSNAAVEALVSDDIDAAEEKISTALKCDSTSSQAWNIKGVIERRLGNTAGAERSYLISMRNNPNDAAAAGNLAALYKAEGFIEEYNKLRVIENNLRKKDPYYFAFLASEALEEKDLAKARKLIQRAIKIHPKDADFYVTLSYIYHLQGKSGEAVNTLTKARNYVASDKVEDLEFLIQNYRTNIVSK
jgi:Flp pilus assembly protein TadD